jgi:hypothetical protein
MDIMMESHPIEEPEAIIPMETVSSGSTKDDEAIIPPETASNDSNTIRTVRKAARRTESWYLPPPQLRRGTGERQLPGYFASLPSPPPPQDEGNPAARKKPRIEEPFSGSTDEAATNTASTDISVGHSPPPAIDDIDDNGDANANADPVSDPQSKPRAKKRDWTLEEDSKLTSAVANTSKKKYGKEFKTDWVTISALVPGRTRKQCMDRWHDVVDPNIDRASGRAGKWAEDEDKKLKDAVQTHDGKDWIAISVLVPGRTKKQCRDRWKKRIDANRSTSSGRMGTWVEEEDSKLKDAVQTHGGKKWGATAALVPGRTEKQCRDRWNLSWITGPRSNGKTVS